MTYTQRVINDRPLSLFALQEGDLAFADSMSVSTANVIGSPVIAPPLVVGGGNSYVFNGSANFHFPSRVFSQDSVTSPFSLEAWFKPVSVSAYKGIVGHAVVEDGLGFDGEQIYFITDHGTAGRAVANFAPSSTTGSFHVVGVHTGAKNELYVNGVRVAVVDLTEDQINTPYYIPTSNGDLYVGHHPGSAIIDSVAVYAQALNSRTVKLHFLWGKDVPDLREVISVRDGTYWTFSDDTTKIALDFSFDTDAEWTSGVTTDVNMVNNMLLPMFDEAGLTRDGTWIAGFILGAIGETIDGSKIEWDSDGPINVHTSVDNGLSWNAAVNGREVPQIGSSFFSDDRSLQVRVTFPAGEPADTITRMRSLSIKMYESRESRASTSGQDAKFRGRVALASEIHQPLHHEDKFGVDLYAGTVTVPSVETRTAEMWVNLSQTPPNDKSIFDARPGVNSYLKFANSQWSTPEGTEVYINGEKKAGAAIELLPSRWNHVVITTPLITGPVVLGGDSGFSMRIGAYANYKNILSDAEVKSLYNSYIGVTQGVVSDTTGLSINDPGSPGIKIYAYSWSLASSG